ncbi:tRNA-intron lyase [Candidatus Micrarchaeota archaeon]|nr:tRNA-intron lyase [Candidatus Micrarchaeota archaeon]
MEARITRDGALISDQTASSELAAKGYGEMTGKGLLLSREESVLMSENRKEFSVRSQSGKKYAYAELLRHYSGSDNEFAKKYLAFRDLRTRGFCVKPGFRGESHYRVYSRGDKPSSGNAIWLVKCVTEEATFSFPQLEKEIQSASSVRKKVMYAISDKEGDMTYYIIDKANP